jgi:nitrogen fixation/metabolism regulation signal transduction histidine kinase
MVTTGLVSFVLAALFSAVLLVVVRSSLGTWQNRAVERGIEVAVAAARTPDEQQTARSAFVAYHQLQAVRSLIEQRVLVAGLGFGLVALLLALAVGSYFLMRITRPLEELTRAIEQAGRGDLNVRVRAEPESEIGAVAAAFNRTAGQLRAIQEELRRAERLAAWRDVARVLCHEVRNPLTPIRLSVERLQNLGAKLRGSVPALSGDPDIVAVIDRTCRTVLAETEALDRTVNEFADFARLPAPRLRRVKLNRLLADAVAEYSAGSQVRVETRFDPAADDWVLDPVLMRRALANLLKNSIEALTERSDASCPRVPAVLVAATIARGRCEVMVADNGPGLASEVKARLFEPYVTTKAKGTGLGLAVVRQVAEAHGGEVRVEPGLDGTGTAFVISLPQGACDESETTGS